MDFIAGDRVHTITGINGIIGETLVGGTSFIMIIPDLFITDNTNITCEVLQSQIFHGWTDGDIKETDEKPNILDLPLSVVTKEIVTGYAKKINFHKIVSGNALVLVKEGTHFHNFTRVLDDIEQITDLGFDVVVHTDEVGKISFTLVYNESISNGLLYENIVSVDTQITGLTLETILSFRASKKKREVVLGASIITLDRVPYSLNEFMTVFCKYVYKPKHK